MKPLFSRLNAWKKPDEDEEYFFSSTYYMCLKNLFKFRILIKDSLTEQLIHSLKSLKQKKVT